MDEVLVDVVCGVAYADYAGTGVGYAMDVADERCDAVGGAATLCGVESGPERGERRAGTALLHEVRRGEGVVRIGVKDYDFGDGDGEFAAKIGQCGNLVWDAGCAADSDVVGDMQDERLRWTITRGPGANKT